MTKYSPKSRVHAITIVSFVLCLAATFTTSAHGAARKSRSTPSIPTESNKQVRKWIHFFSVDDSERFARFMARGTRYRPLIEKTLTEHGVPSELYYLAMIESGFARKARSHAEAVGIWQFIAPTARRYGLRVNREVDERLDLVRSTKAAARYLKDLNDEFDSWYLAMAAYNCGENRIRRAIRRHRTKDFWKLARLGAIPKETVNYIPKFQAAMQIGSAPEAYGFKRPRENPIPRLRAVRVRDRATVRTIAHRHGSSPEKVTEYNPHLIRGRTPKTRLGYEVWLPH